MSLPAADIAQSNPAARFESNPAFLRGSERLARPDAAPVIVIGMPRSGSTFLTHVLNCLDDLLVFDDLYCLQKAESLGCRGPMTPEQVEKLVEFLGWQTRARIRHGGRFEQWPMEWTDVDGLCGTVAGLFRDARATWPELMNEYLTRLAGFLGRGRWGYKTPQDFHHIERLHARFPNAQFIFVMRDPREMMASYKFNNTQDGRPGQYHPWAYAHYWRRAIDKAQATCERLDLPLHIVRLEDLKNDPDRTAHAMGAFLNAPLVHAISRSRPNTSFAGHDRREITPTEHWLCEQVCGEQMILHGYIPSHSRPCVADVPNLLSTTVRFLVHQSLRFLRDPVARVKIRSFCG